jgi:8-oxo-dGTP diphosphatase
MRSKNEAISRESQSRELYSIPINEFFKSAFSVDCVIFGYHHKELKALLIKRGTDPYKGIWALPGDLVYPNEDLDTAASRVLEDLTSLSGIPIQQIYTFGKVDRHPLGRVITVAYMAIVEMQDITPIAASKAIDAQWHSVKEIPKLAFDHKEILGRSLLELQNGIRQEPLWHKVLPPKFTLTQLQEFYETVLNKKLDKGNFRKKLQEMKFIQKLNETQQNVKHRPSLLYKFNEKNFVEWKEKGFLFEL